MNNIASFYNEEWIDGEKSQPLFQSFQPFVCRKTGYDLAHHDDIIRSLSCNDDEIEFSCQDKVSIEFQGDPIERETVKVSMSSFIESMSCLQSDKHHWIHEVEFNLYLAQHSIYNKHNQTPSSLQQNSDIYSIPIMLQKEDIQTVNLWMNLFRAKSSLHYDSFHNILIVTSGYKRVRLISPEHTPLLQPYEASKTAPNHSHLDTQCIFEKSFDEIAKPNDVELGPGDALFIPEGWWHVVESDPCTVGINFWFLSPWGKLVDQSHMCPYFMRSSFHECVQLKSKDYPLSASEHENTRIQTPSVTSKKRTFHAIGIESTVDSSYNLFKEQIQKLHTLRYSLPQSREKITTSTAQSVDELERELVSMPFDSMYTLWPRFALEFPEQWMDMLLSLSPISIHTLTQHWDSIESSTTTSTTTSTDSTDSTDESSRYNFDKFFAGIYDPIGDRAVEVRCHFINQKDALLRDIGSVILRNVLKITASK